MALSVIVIPGDGVTTQHSIPFALGYIREQDITCRVGDEVDGTGAPVYRALTFLSDEVVEVAGPPAAIGEDYTFTRTVNRSQLLVDYEDGAIQNEGNLNTAQKQSLMLVHEVLDGRFEQFFTDLDMTGFRVINVGDPEAPGDLVTLGYVTERSGNAISAANAAEAARDAALVAQAAASTSASNAALSAAEALANKNETDTNAAAAEASAVVAASERVLAQTARAGSEDARDIAEAAAVDALAYKNAAGVSESNAYASAVIATTKAAEAADAAAEAATFDPDDYYLKTEVDALIAAGGVPIGASIFWNAATTLPTGFVKENGAAYSRTVYSELFAAIGTTFGAGDGSTTFNVPESRGEFIRALADGRAVDTGRVLGSAQLDAMQGHRHAPLTGTGFMTVLAGGANGASGGDRSNTATTGNPITDGVNGTPRTAAETRPRNVAKLVLIRAF